jgi:hypothetical protein
MAEALQVPFRAKRPARTQKCARCLYHWAEHHHHWVRDRWIRDHMRARAKAEGLEPKYVRLILGRLLRDERNLWPVCRDCHPFVERNHTPPESAFEFASELGPEWLARLQRLHP